MGATFVVRLPIVAMCATPAEAATATQTARVDAPDEAIASLSGLSVLVVDDDKESLAIVSEYLAGQQATVLTAATTKPRPNYVAALSAVTTLASELTSNKHTDEAASIMAKLDAWTAAVGDNSAAALTSFARTRIVSTRSRPASTCTWPNRSIRAVSSRRLRRSGVSGSRLVATRSAFRPPPKPAQELRPLAFFVLL
jgi:CheY-like chemotaxis protein